uniref:Uncharacterized aarF domain-containing protein kinase 2-like n=1 Tax=Saccoglossus kowalevskii TaxID=10224 RepID=A0ABM0MK45_SACKO|nr:PREDICTED: uncharacterized aarF domain-containing protein kinase 2-like [Saccoglossus kowalevskii]
MYIMAYQSILLLGRSFHKVTQPWKLFRAAKFRSYFSFPGAIHGNQQAFRKNSQFAITLTCTALTLSLSIKRYSDTNSAFCNGQTIIKTNKVAKTKRNIITKTYRSLYKYLTLCMRFLRLLLTFLPLYCIFPWTLVFPSFKQKWLRYLLFAVECSGPTFIKLGQWSSTRRDLFSQEFCDCFSKLHNNAPPHSWFFTKKKLEKSFGNKWRDIFVKIDNKRQAVRSGCIGQVYKAYMKPDSIPDEHLVEEILEEIDDSDAPDFFEGLEVLGFGRMFGARDKELDRAEKDRKVKKKEKLLADENSFNPQERSDQSNDLQDKPKSDNNFILDEDDLDGLIPVAIKVVHPGVYRNVSRDLKLLYFMANLLSYIPGLSYLSLREVVEEFEGLLTRQIDLRYEAKNLERFNVNFSDVSCVKFPKPIRPYVRKDVMVETYEEGECISKYLNDNENSSEELRNKLADMAIDALLKMVFVDNFVHADLHPGNILVHGASDFNPQQENIMTLVDICDTVIINVKPVPCPVKLILLDTGITSELEEEDRWNFEGVFTAVVLGDGEKVADLFLHHACAKECEDVDKFKKEMSTLVREATKNTLNLSKVNVGELLRSVFSLLIEHKVKLESNFASMVLAIMVLEGLGRSLNPNLDIMAAAKAVLLP